MEKYGSTGWVLWHDNNWLDPRSKDRLRNEVSATLQSACHTGMCYLLGPCKLVSGRAEVWF